LAHVWHFRAQFVQRAKLPERTKWLLARIDSADLRAERQHLIRAWLLTRHVEVISAFLDQMHVPHTRGMIDKSAEPVSVSAVRDAILHLLKHFTPLFVGEYLGYLVLHRIDVLAAVAPALIDANVDLRKLLGIGVETESVAIPPASPEQAVADMPPVAQTIDADEFSTLDHLLIRTIVASAFQEDGALTLDQLEDLVDETVELNASRYRTLFHRGFLHAILDRPLVFHFAGENEVRRLWYLTGAMMGLLRSGDPSRILKLIAEQKRLVSTLIDRSDVACGSLLLVHVYRPLLEAGELAMLCKWIRRHIERAPMDTRCGLLADLQGDGDDLLKASKTSEASLVFDAVHDVTESSIDLPEGFRKGVQIANRRRRAQVLQARGHFSQAKTLFEDVANTGMPVDAARALGDLGLIEAGFRAMEPALPRPVESANVALCAALSRGQPHFERAVALSRQAAIKGNFALGILELVGPRQDPAKSAEHLRDALDAMLRRERSYSGTGLIEWSRFCLAVATLEMLDDSLLHAAADLVDRSLRAPVEFPEYLWERAVQAAASYGDHSVAERICQHLIQGQRAVAYRVLASSSLPERSPALRRVYIEWLTGEMPSTDKKWTGATIVLRSALSAGESDLAEQALDVLEGVATEIESRRSTFLEMLGHADQYSPAWDSEDAEGARIRLYELDGQYESAAQLLLTRFHRLRQQGTDYQIAQSRQVLEQIKAYRLESLDIVGLERMVADGDSDAAQGIGKSLKDTSRRINVLYVGGNEIQRQYEQPIRLSLAKTSPAVDAAFMFPGWSSNWIFHVDDFKRRLVRTDVVVLSSLVRTQFGRHVRALCDSQRPWFPCTGRGRQSLLTSIERAALYVAGRRASGSVSRT
ncbi:MAG: hypothetical protein NTV94_16285, partial [Planctomycetota bacterium]|nr:hypothetical protein [Planctomycetota bacterium]